MAPDSIIINKKSLAVGSITVNNKEYDGTTSATIGVATLSGSKFNADEVTLNNGTAAFDNANVGSSKLVTFKSFTITG
jgi:hypothetical protein